jgi:hypothetical protein
VTYFIQATAAGWTMYRAAGIQQRYGTLASALMVAKDMGYKLVILDRDGNRMN